MQFGNAIQLALHYQPLCWSTLGLSMNMRTERRADCREASCITILAIACAYGQFYRPTGFTETAISAFGRNAAGGCAAVFAYKRPTKTAALITLVFRRMKCGNRAWVREKLPLLTLSTSNSRTHYADLKNNYLQQLYAACGGDLRPLWRTRW